MVHRSGPDGHALTYKLEGSTSRAVSGPHGPVDIVAKTRWNGRSLIVDERRWEVRGEEAINVRRILWLDDRGFLNLEVSSPRPIGESDSTTVVMKREPLLLDELLPAIGVDSRDLPAVNLER